MVCERATAETKRPSFAEFKAMNPTNLATIEEQKETHCSTAKGTLKEAEKFGLDHKIHKTFMKGFPYKVRNEQEEEEEEDEDSRDEEESLRGEFIKQALKELEEYDEDESEDPAYYYYPYDDDDDYSSLENEEKEGYVTAKDDDEDNDADIDHNECGKVCNYKDDSCEDSSEDCDCEYCCEDCDCEYCCEDCDCEYCCEDSSEDCDCEYCCEDSSEDCDSGFEDSFDEDSDDAE